MAADVRRLKAIYIFAVGGAIALLCYVLRLRLRHSYYAVPLTPATLAYLSTVGPTDFHSPLPQQRELREASAAALRLRTGVLPMRVVEDVSAPGGSMPLLRIFAPLEEDATQPIILYAHGGGWVLSSVRTHDELCRRLARAARTTVISVEYRLSPEHAYPAALDDMEEGYRFSAAKGRGVILAGDSAGGNLAAGLALRLRDSAAPGPRALLLIYPALDASCSSESYSTFARGYGLTKQGMLFFWAAYLGGEDRLSTAGAHASPARAASVQGLPPTLTLVSQADVLRDEGVQFHARLAAAGVHSELEVALGQVHGFIKRPNNPESNLYLEALGERIMRIAQRSSMGGTPSSII